MRLYLDFSEVKEVLNNFKPRGNYSLLGLVAGLVLNCLGLIVALTDVVRIDFENIEKD